MATQVSNHTHQADRTSDCMACWSMALALTDVWCAKCDQPSIADFRDGDETVALCGKHAAERWPSEWLRFYSSREAEAAIEGLRNARTSEGEG